MTYDTPAATPREALLDALTAIFTRQRELMDGFKRIEQLPDPPLPIQSPYSQKLLKDFAWRFTEELTEAYDQWENVGDREATFEELSDATHFIVELMLFAGISPAQCVQALDGRWPNVENPVAHTGRFDHCFWHITQNLGMAMQCLKNKPWKQKPVMTNEALFRQRVLLTFKSFCQLWADLGQPLTSFHGHYFQKSNVVQERQDNGY